MLFNLANVRKFVLLSDYMSIISAEASLEEKLAGKTERSRSGVIIYTWGSDESGMHWCFPVGILLYWKIPVYERVLLKKALQKIGGRRTEQARRFLGMPVHLRREVALVQISQRLCFAGLSGKF